MLRLSGPASEGDSLGGGQRAVGLNSITLIGNLGRDPEIRYTPSGKPVTSFTLATSRTWLAPDGERREETEWFNVISWGNLAEICKRYLGRGSRVYIEGRLQTREWEDSDGLKHCRTEVVADEMIRLDARSSFSAQKEDDATGGFFSGRAYLADQPSDRME
jgi:single-strand DNA-binding protein